MIDLTDTVQLLCATIIIGVLIFTGTSCSEKQEATAARYIREHKCVQAGVTNLGRDHNQPFYKCGNTYLTEQELRRM